MVAAPLELEGGRRRGAGCERLGFEEHLIVPVADEINVTGSGAAGNRKRFPLRNDEAVVDPELDPLLLVGARDITSCVERVGLTEGGAHQARPARSPVSRGTRHPRGERRRNREVDGLVRLHGADAVGAGCCRVAAKLVCNEVGGVGVVGRLEAAGYGERGPHVVCGAARGIVGHDVGAVAAVRDRRSLVPSANCGAPIVVGLPALACHPRPPALDNSIGSGGARGRAVELAYPGHKVVTRVGAPQVVVLVAGLDGKDARDTGCGQGESVAGGRRRGGAGHVGEHGEGEGAAKHAAVIGLCAPNHHVVAARASRRVPQHEPRVVEVGGRRDLVPSIGARPNVADRVDKAGNVGGRGCVLHDGRGLERHGVIEAKLDPGLHDGGIRLPVAVPVLDRDGHRREHARRGEREADPGGNRLGQVTARGLGDHAKGALVDSARAKDDTNVVGTRLGGSVHDAVGAWLRGGEVLHEARGAVHSRQAHLEVVTAGAPEVAIEILGRDGELCLQARRGQLKTVPRARLVGHRNRLGCARARRLDIDRVGGAHDIVAPVQVRGAHVAEALAARRPLQLLAGGARPCGAPRGAVLHLGVVVVG